MVDKPTRVNVNSSTNGPVTSTSLINHIYISHVHNIVKVHVSNVTLSDHYLLSDNAMPVFARESMLILPSIIDRLRTLWEARWPRG